MSWNPFRRCCEVPLVVGDLDTPGSVVSGMARIDGADVEFVGLVLGDGLDVDAADTVIAATKHVAATGARLWLQGAGQ